MFHKQALQRHARRRAVELGNAEQMRGGKSFRCRFGRDHDDALNARHLRRNGGHQQRGRQWVTAAGDVAAYGAKRTNELAGDQAGDRFITPRCWQLVDGETANLLSGSSESHAHRGRNRLPCRGHLFCCYAQPGYIGEAVKLSGIAQQCTVALLTH